MPISEGKRQSLRKRHWLCMGEVSVQVTKPRRRPVRRAGPVKSKCMGFAAHFAQWTPSKNKSFFLSVTKIQLKRVYHKLSRRTIDALLIGCACEASISVTKSLVQHGLVEKRQTSWIENSFCLEATNFKKPNTTDLERDLQRPRLRRSTIDRRRQTWTPSAGRSSCFFFLFSAIA